jgi:hypothetical protein
LESGLPRFPQGFSCPVVLGNRVQGVRAAFAYGAITRSGGTFQILRLAVGLVTPRRVCSSSDPVPQPPTGNACRLAPAEFGLFPVRSPLLGESRLLSFPRGTEMFQFPRFASHRLWIQRWIREHYLAWVPPFGHPRITACLRLPAAYRSLPRPSSLPGAKASTVRP